MKKLFPILFISALFCLIWVRQVNANVYASQLDFTNPDSSEFDGSFSDGTGILFVFFLNDTAKSVIINVKDASNGNVVATINAGAMSRGKQSVSWDGAGAEDGKSYYYEVTAEQDSYSSTDWKVFYDSGDINIFTYEADVVTDMSSPLFGLIYTPNQGGPLGRGITIYNPDGSHHDPFLVAEDPGDGSIWGTDDPTVAGMFDDLGRFYTCSHNFGEVRRLNLDYSLTTVASGFTYPKGLFIADTGANRKIYLCAENRVYRLNIGNDDAFTGTPEVIAEFSNGFPNHVAIDDSGYLYVSIITDSSDIYSAGNGLYRFDISNTLPVTENDALLNIAGATAHDISDLVFDYGTDRGSNSDDILYYCTTAGTGSPDDGIWRIDDITSGFALPLPIILEDSIYGAPDFNFYTGAIPIDAAGNFILFENWNEHLHFISPPSSSPTNSFTTTSPANFDVGGSVGVQEEYIPKSYFLAQNFPNPFNPATNIRFGIAKGSNVYLAVYNAIGEEVAILINNEFKSAGTHNIKFNAESARGGLPSGIYIYRLKTNSKILSKKMILLK